MSTATTPPARDAAGKYLTFFVGDEEYGIAILRVQEIIGVRAIAGLPRTPVFVRGRIILRGKVVPVVDLRERFGLPPADAGRDPRQAARTEALRCVVVVEVAIGAGRGASVRVPMGLVVDRVSDVTVFDAECIEGPPTFGGAVPTDFLLGRTTGGPRGRLLLDVDRVLAPDGADAPIRAAA